MTNNNNAGSVCSDPLPPNLGGSYDLLIIGAGPGGYRAAELAAKHGLQVVIVEQDQVGGTCLNVGCIPTKCYVHSATFEEARERVAQVIPQLRQGVEGILSHPGITLLRGHAEFVSANEVTILPLQGESEGVRITASNIIIATGSKAKLLPLPDISDPRVVTSTELLQLVTLPKKLCIIGAGVIGMEFASVFHRFGSEVTVIEYLKECLPMLDSDVAKRLRKLMEKRGITFRMKTAVQSLADIDADVILMATGRQPNTDGLNLEAAGITLDARGSIPVDDNYQIVNCKSSNCKCFAIGDVNGRQMLAHAAEHQALMVVEQILQPPLLLERAGGEAPVPAAIFTEPEAACVGPSEDQLKAQGTDYRCGKAFWRANGKALAMGETEGLLKLFASATDGRILGCHAFGAHAADIVQEVSVLMCRETTVEQLRHMVHIHPTLGEIVLDAAANL